MQRARAYIAERRAKHHETAGSGVLYDNPALFSLLPLAPDNVPPTAYNRRMEIDMLPLDSRRQARLVAVDVGLCRRAREEETEGGADLAVPVDDDGG